ncbi:MAG: L,D-transpeptidase [Rhizobiaceae bacterium]
MTFNIANKAPQIIAATAAGFFAFAVAINMTPAYATIQSVEAKVDISEQRMQVFVNGVHKHTFKVSTAGRGYRTPTGTWKPYRMHKMWYSRKYDNAPMPHSIFYNGGYAVHATNAIRRLGRPASHGCVRLHPKNAKEFFGLVLAAGRKNTTITVTK